MKCDGHAKLTDAALNIVINRCKVDLTSNNNACKLPDFKPATSRTWVNNGTSNSSDNASSVIDTVIDQLTPNIPALDNFRGYLTERVVAIDLDIKYINNHRAPEGQRFHFMKAGNETVSQAYNNGIEFIRHHAESWVAGTLQVKKYRRNVIHTRLRERAIEHMALALHCLQDTFSAGHVKRSKGKNAKLPGSIVEVFEFNKVNRVTHSAHDYKAGSVKSLSGQFAINASADLILKCMKAYANGNNRLNDWDAFRIQWLNFSPKIGK